MSTEWIWDETISRRRLLKAGLAAGAGLSAASFLAACSDTTVPGGQSPNKAPGGLPLARPDNPVTLPIYPDNEAIPSGIEAEGGPLKLYNWAEYINPPVIKSFEKRYGVEVELSTFSTIDEAVAKLASGAVGFDVFVPTQPFISMLVSGRILQPLNLSYIPNLHRNVWPSLVDPWYDRGSRYTVPYTIYTTGISWRNDFLPDYDPSKLRNPYESFWQATDIAGRVGILDDQREGLAMGLLRNGVTDVNTEDAEAARRRERRAAGTDRQGQPALLHQRVPAPRRRLDVAAPGLVGRHRRDRLLHAEGHRAGARSATGGPKTAAA